MGEKIKVATCNTCEEVLGVGGAEEELYRLTTEHAALFHREEWSHSWSGELERETAAQWVIDGIMALESKAKVGVNE